MPYHEVKIKSLNTGLTFVEICKGEIEDIKKSITEGHKATGIPRKVI